MTDVAAVLIGAWLAVARAVIKKPAGIWRVGGFLTLTTTARGGSCPATDKLVGRQELLLEILYGGVPGTLTVLDVFQISGVQAAETLPGVGPSLHHEVL